MASIPLVPETDIAVVLEEDARRRGSEYGHGMERLGALAKTYAIEIVIVILVLVGMVDTIRGTPRARPTRRCGSRCRLWRPWRS